MARPPESRSISRIRCCGLISVRRRGGVQRMLGFPVANLLPPGFPRCRLVLSVRRREFVQDLVELLQHALHIAHDGQVGGAILADLGRIDVHVNHLGVWRERGKPARNAIVKAHAERDQQIAVPLMPMFAA